MDIFKRNISLHLPPPPKKYFLLQSQKEYLMDRKFQGIHLKDKTFSSILFNKLEIYLNYTLIITNIFIHCFTEGLQVLLTLVKQKGMSTNSQ